MPPNDPRHRDATSSTLQAVAVGTCVVVASVMVLSLAQFNPRTVSSRSDPKIQAPDATVDVAAVEESPATAEPGFDTELVRGRLVYIELDDRRRHRLARGALARRRRPSLCLRCLRSTGRRRRIALWPALPVQRPDRIGQRSRRDPWPAHALPHPLPIARRLTNFQPAAVAAPANLVARLRPPNPPAAARR